MQHIVSACDDVCVELDTKPFHGSLQSFNVIRTTMNCMDLLQRPNRWLAVINGVAHRVVNTFSCPIDTGSGSESGASSSPTYQPNATNGSTVIDETSNDLLLFTLLGGVSAVVLSVTAFALLKKRQQVEPEPGWVTAEDDIFYVDNLSINDSKANL